MLARRSDHLLALSIAALVAAVIGVQLGRGTIAEINPIHFRGPAAPPRGIDPNAGPPPAEAFAQAEVWGQSHRPPPFDCGRDCDAYAARQAAAVAIVDTAPRTSPSGPYWRDATPTAEPAAWTPGETGPRALSVERYMHYPVEEASPESAPVAAEEDKPVPAAEEDSSKE
jgi:hypothetical protein